MKSDADDRHISEFLDVRYPALGRGQTDKRAMLMANHPFISL
jgi:hypothetical protein